MSPLVDLQEVTKTFPARGSRAGKAFTAVDAASLQVERGRVSGIIGYSGAGKSTLVRLVNGLERPTSGRVVVDDRDITDLGESGLRQVRSRIGMVFQQFNLLSSRTVAGNVAFALRTAGWSRADTRRRVDEVLGFVGLESKARSHPQQLSGGQRQRVGIARALATSPPLLLADEATSALDPETTGEVLDLLRRVNTELGTTIIVITHEMDVVRALCDEVAVMDDGRIVEHGPVYDVFADPREHVTRSFVRTALRDRPGPQTLQRLREHHRGRLVTLAVRDDQDSQGQVWQRLRDTAVTSAVVFGGISEVAARPVGSLTYELTGADADVDALVSALREVTDVHEEAL